MAPRERHRLVALDLAAEALQESPTLEEFAGRVSDSGEGRWTSIAAIEAAFPPRC